MIVDKEDKIHVLVKRTDRKGFCQFVEEVDQVSKQGHKLMSGSYGRQNPIPGPWSVWFEKVGEISNLDDPEETKEREARPEDVEKSIDELTTKKDLLDFAKKYNIEVPEDVKFPKAIQKFIKEILDKREN